MKSRSKMLGRPDTENVFASSTSRQACEEKKTGKQIEGSLKSLDLLRLQALAAKIHSL